MMSVSARRCGSSARVSSGVFVDGMHIVDRRGLHHRLPVVGRSADARAIRRRARGEAEEVGDRLWIWVYHAPPDDSPTSWTGKRHYGDADLNQWIERHEPGIVLCGHVHESPFVDRGSWVDRIGPTWVVNSGREGRIVPPRPPHIVFDTDTRLATWWSSEGTAELSLDAQYSG